MDGFSGGIFPTPWEGPGIGRSGVGRFVSQGLQRKEKRTKRRREEGDLTKTFFLSYLGGSGKVSEVEGIRFGNWDVLELFIFISNAK